MIEQLRYSIQHFTIVVLCLSGALLLEPSLVWSMGTPPFDADLRSNLGATTKASLDLNKCLRTDEVIESVSVYRNLKSRKPIANKKITATVSFPGRDRKGSRLISVFYTAETSADGQVSFSIPLSKALEDAKQALRTDRFYRGVTRVRGRINLSLSSEDTLRQSIRYVPARGFFFRLCRSA